MALSKKVSREDILTIRKIVDRAENLGLLLDTRFNHLMDVRVAVDQFDMRLNDWLNADDENFYHDWLGIYANVNRETCKIGNFFMPRFANPTKKGE